MTDLTRGSEERLPVEDAASHMDWTPDGEKLLFYTIAPQRWKTIDVNTGQQKELGLEHPGYRLNSVRFSPDQKWIVFHDITEKAGTHSNALYVARVTEGVANGPREWVRIAGEMRRIIHPWWSPEGNRVYFVSDQDDFLCIWTVPLDSSTKEPLETAKVFRHFHERPLLVGGWQIGYALASDRLYLPLTEEQANVWLAEPLDTE